MTRTAVRAAGGLVWRDGPAGQPLVCLIRRHRYDDWSLPKGKVRRGEHPLAAAVREVREETGVLARPQLPMPPTRYHVDGRPKVVDYWLMSALEVPEFQPNSEVDELAWLPVDEARQRLQYPHDRHLVHLWAGRPLVSAVVLLVRHAYAGERDLWSGPDHIRPLIQRGLAQAEALCGLLALFSPGELVSATPRRCVQTLLPLTRATGLPVTAEAAFDESAADPNAAADLLVGYAGATACTVVCTQGAVIPPVLARLSGDLREGRWTTAKGDGWLLPFSGSTLLAPAPLEVGPPKDSRRPDLR